MRYGKRMHINSEQIAIIRQTAQESFGPEARVWLFGSRVDDGKLGGEMDLLGESAAPIDNPVLLAAQLSARLQRKMHGRKVDVLLLAPNLRRLPIHDIALGEGVRLNIPQKLRERLQFLARVIERESTRLQNTDQCLFTTNFTPGDARRLNHDTEQAERVDAFVSRFGRLQDTLAT